jgi:hypothetical protein
MLLSLHLPRLINAVSALFYFFWCPGCFYYTNTKDGSTSWDKPASSNSLVSQEEIEASKKFQGLWRKRQGKQI